MTQQPAGPRTFPFAFAAPFRLPLALIGVRPRTAAVEVDEDRLTVRFGPYRLRTARGNVLDARRGGPYRWWKAIGPHLSLVDRGVTFGTTPALGVCIRFRAPVPALFGRWIAHPAVTVTVEDPDGLVATLTPPAPA